MSHDSTTLDDLFTVLQRRRFCARWKGPALRLFVWPAIPRSDGLILLQQHKNTISDKNIWYWINFGAFFDQNDVIARAKLPTLRIFPGKPGGSFKLSFFASFMIWSPLSGDIPSIRVDQSKFKCFMLRFGCFMSRSSVSIFKMLEKKSSLAFDFIWPIHFSKWACRTKVITETKFLFSRNSYSAMRNLDAPCFLGGLYLENQTK